MNTGRREIGAKAKKKKKQINRGKLSAQVLSLFFFLSYFGAGNHRGSRLPFYNATRIYPFCCLALVAYLKKKKNMFILEGKKKNEGKLRQ